MIPAAVKLSPAEFARKYPPGGKGKASSRTSSSPNRHPILNDVPLAATSCLLYEFNDLKDNAKDHTFPIPDTLGELRELKSLEAVVKRMPDGKNTVFSHMFVSPADVAALLDEELLVEMKEIQRDVRAFSVLLILDHRRRRFHETFREILPIESQQGRHFELYRSGNRSEQAPYSLASRTQCPGGGTTISFLCSPVSIAASGVLGLALSTSSFLRKHRNYRHGDTACLMPPYSVPQTTIPFPPCKSISLR